MKVFVYSKFWGVTSWYQSFSLSELGNHCSVPRLKLSKLVNMSSTLGKVLGGESARDMKIHESRNYVNRGRKFRVWSIHKAISY